MKNRIVSRLSKDTIRFLDFVDFMGYVLIVVLLISIGRCSFVFIYA